MIKPVRAYDIQTLGCAKLSQIRNIQALHYRSLRQITSAPWYASNLSRHKDLKIETVSTSAQNYS